MKETWNGERGTRKAEGGTGKRERNAECETRKAERGRRNGEG